MKRIVVALMPSLAITAAQGQTAVSDSTSQKSKPSRLTLGGYGEVGYDFGNGWML
jgi:hypothetical protein